MTEINYGPLQRLIGKWEGAQGMDISPEPDGSEESPFYETLTFEAGGDVSNAKKQHLAIVPYTQIVRRKSNDEVFHHQYGYWLYDEAENTVMQSLVIPRGVCVLAGGKASTNAEGKTVIEVAAKLGNSNWGVLQSPFMEQNAKTTAFTHKITIDGDSLSYTESTMLDIYGKAFDHGDTNTLIRVN